MSSSEEERESDKIGQLLNSLLQCSPDKISAWVDAHQSHLNLHFLQTLKDSYAITSYILAEPNKAERATRYGLLIAEQMVDEQLALPLARWARGMYEMFHAPEKAIDLFQQAQVVYQAVGNELVVAFLNVNLVGVLTECGRFAEAEIAYQAAHPELLKLVDVKPIYLLWLEQNYGWLLYSQGRYTDALIVLDRVLHLAQQYNFSANINGIQVNRHLALGMLGRLAEVESGFLEERATAFANKQMLTVARIDMNLGDLYTSQGRVAAALQYFQKAKEAFATLDNEMEVGSVLFRQAALLSRIGVCRAAIRYYAQALPIFSQREMLPQMGELLVSYAIAQRREGEYRRAASILGRAEQIWQQLANRLWQAIVIIEQIALAFDQKDYPAAQQLIQCMPELRGALRIEAELSLYQADLWRIAATDTHTINAAHQAYTAALDYATKHGERWIERRALFGLGKLWLATDLVRASNFFEQAAAIDTAMRQTLTVEELKASFHEQANDLFNDLICQAIEENHAAKALHYVWRAKASALLDLFYAIQSEALLPPTTKAAIEQTRQQIATLRWQLATQADPMQPTLEQNSTQIAGFEQQLLDLRRQRNDAKTRQHAAFALEATTNPLTLIAKMEGELLLEYVRCGDDIWGIIANKTGHCKGMCLIDVETVTDIHARLQLRFGNVIAQPSERRQQWNQHWVSESLPLLRQCYQSLVAPLFAMMPGAEVATKILIAPCDPLFLLPFAAFWNGQKFWAEICIIELIPSGALLGTPIPDVTECSAPIVIAASTGNMTAVRTEANCITDVLPTTLTFIDRPALPFLLSLKTPPKILHIAAHSLLRADAPLFTGLQLSGEVLTVEQSYELPLHGTELVTLAGCTTASGQESESALLAFQNAFLLAGVQRVLTTLWPIADDATVLWMEHFYDCLADKMTIPQALQNTQLYCLAEPALCHPAIWAPFVLTRR